MVLIFWNQSFVQVGHFKEPMGFEELTSSKYLTFMERSLTDSDQPSRNSGVMIGNSSQSDINPSIAAGYSGAIYIKYEPWKLDRGIVIESDKVLQADSMRELADNWDKVVGHLEKVLSV